MKIETKYDVGDTVYTIIDNRIQLVKVSSLNMSSGVIIYNFQTVTPQREEKDCFLTLDDMFNYYKVTLTP